MYRKIIPITPFLIYAGSINADTKPNIILINIDDLGWTDLSSNGSKYYETPNIDRLKADGVWFGQAYAGAANSAPSRACMLTGQNTMRHGIYTVGNPDRGNKTRRKLISFPNRTSLPEGFQIIPKILKYNGYATYHIGKWHVTESPKECGIDVNIGGNHAGHPDSYFPPYKNPDLKDGPKGEFLTERLSIEAVNLIKKADSKKPFFLYFATYAVHTPLQAKKVLIEKYKNKKGTAAHNNPVYAALVEEADRAVGKVLEAIREKGIEDNTLIIFTTDNGGVYNISRQWPLRAGKGSFYEGGIRVPMIIYQKGKYEKAEHPEAIVSQLDIFPTLMELTGTETDNLRLDGKSLVNILNGKEESNEDERTLFWHFPAYLEGGNKETTDRVFRSRPVSVLRKGDWKIILNYETGLYEMYNIKDDIGEKKNLISSYPGKAYEMMTELQKKIKETNSPTDFKLNPFFKSATEKEPTAICSMSPEQIFAYTNYRKYSEQAKENKDSRKAEAVKTLRKYFHDKPYRAVKDPGTEAVKEYLSLLADDGTFTDMNPIEEGFRKNSDYYKGYENTTDDKVGLFIAKALNRVYSVCNSYNKGNITYDSETFGKLMKAVLHYGNIEISRPNYVQRFHASCFAIPSAASNIYFACLDEMDKAESGESPELTLKACDMLKVLGLEAYTQPLRNDDTDNKVISVDRFRKHVWWVGGNALAYRSLLPVAAMFSSVPMIDLLADICLKGIDMTSQTTYDKSFWTEGFTADGAGWGHGKQCLIWGYPIDGTFNALNMLGMLKGTPWAASLKPENVKALMNFFRGGNWYYYKGYRLVGIDRNSCSYNPYESHIPYKKMLDLILRDWSSSFSEKEITELEQLQKEVDKNRILMAGYDKGIYNGIRWFFNNDDIIKKNKDYMISVNMGTVRSDGLESATFADNYNFYPTDGMTLFMRNGNEYFKIIGGWDVTASPGVTAREGMDRLKPVTNWRGYCSKHNFAVGATDCSEYAAAGYIFEKIHGADKNMDGTKQALYDENPMLYGFRAHKGYFMMDDYFIALGAGITNDRPEMEGCIRTTIDQTALENDVILSAGRRSEKLQQGVKEIDLRRKNRIWITQKGKFSYTVLPEYTANLYVSLEERKTQWEKLNPTNKKRTDLPTTVPVLRIWTDHGQKTTDDTYGYVVFTGKGKPSAELPFEILRNDTLIQAVASEKEKVISAVFYSADETLNYKGRTISVSSPCGIVIKDQGKGRYEISIADATMNPDIKAITITIDGKSDKIDMPQNLYCGKSITANINL